MDNAQNSTAAGDDSDTDVVTDFLNSNCSQIPAATTSFPINGQYNSQGKPVNNSSTIPTTTTATNNAYAKNTTVASTKNTHSTTTTPTTTPTPTTATSTRITPPELATLARTTTTAKATITESQNYCIPVINAPATNTATTNTAMNINNNSMIPIINVTPHSPAAATKYNNIFEDTLSQLQNIRETVVQMKNSSGPQTTEGGLTHTYGLLGAAILSASLPDLTGTGNAGAAAGIANASALGTNAQYMMWPATTTQPFLLTADRRKSWTMADEQLSAGVCIGADGTNKSVSLSSLDSEEQETIRVTEQRRRTARNSTGGISTHSLNEAELVRDFERIAAKRSLANEIISRIPLQKSISTSSIIAKEDIKAISRHLTDSEDENQSLLRAHAKIEVYDNVEKRRKRGSLFFRKKNKDKAKMKSIGGQLSACDICGASITLAQLKDHQLECGVNNQHHHHHRHSGGGGGGGGAGGSSSNNSNLSGKRHLLLGSASGSIGSSKRLGSDAGPDYYDNSDAQHAAGAQFSDKSPLIRSEFLNEPPLEAHELGADPSLGIALQEHDSWSPGVPKELLKSMQELQIKRQEHIYEFIMTEKHHCQTLLVVQKVFVESLERYFPAFNINGMFPRLAELTELHTGFLKQLRVKQREHPVVDSIADSLLEFLALEQSQRLRLAYGEFCANHRTALEQFKQSLAEPRFAEWYKHCLGNPLLKKKGIPECILFVTQRLTKYPLLIEPLLKSARDDKAETEKLQHALGLVKALLVDVDACVAEKELRVRQLEIYNRIDANSFAIYRNKPFRKSEVGGATRRRLKFEGSATLMQLRAKSQSVLIVVLTDCLCFLAENSAHKYSFFTPEQKAGVVPLQKLLIREKAGTESRGIYIISSNPDSPEMYELKVQTPKDKNIWIQSIRQAVLECPTSDDWFVGEELTAEEKLRIGVNKRETLEKMRQKDIEQALLLEEKLCLQLNLLKQQFQQQHKTQTEANGGGVAGQANDVVDVVGAANFLATFGSYKDLVGMETNTAELWKRVLSTVQDISQLAATIYTAATGLPVSRTVVSGLGDKAADIYASPTLPKRAETFAGFDEKRGKHAGSAATAGFACRDATKLATLQVLSPRLQELEEKRELKTTPTPTPPTAANTTSASMATSAASCISDPNTLKEHNYAVLQVSHHLQTLLCIISQQMTTIQSLQHQLALFRENPRGLGSGSGGGSGGMASAYTHNDQLEELRNLQDKLQEEKTAWLRQRELQEQDLEETRAAQLKLQAEVKAEQEDIRQQREQLYRKMELLSSQGLLLSPSTPLPFATSTTHLAATVAATGTPHLEGGAHDQHHAYDELGHGSSNHNNQSNQNTTSLNASTATGNSTSQSNATGGSSAVDRRKDKWRTASTISKTPPVHLLSANNAPKGGQMCVKQKLPMKLSSLSSATTTSSSSSSSSNSNSSATNHTKIDKSASFNANSHAAGGMTQLFPLKLADKRNAIVATATTTIATTTTAPLAAPLVPQHARTGSSPAVIQQHATNTPTSSQPAATAPTATTSTSIGRADSANVVYAQQRLQQTPTSSRVVGTLHQALKATTASSMGKQQQQQQQQQQTQQTQRRQNNNNIAPRAKPEEEEIYF